MRLSSIKSLLPFLGLTLLASLHSLDAAVIGYTNDFSGTGENTAFPAENPDAQWSVAGGVYAFSYSSTSVSPSSTSIPITGVAGTDFVMQSQFTVNSTGFINGNGATVGFGLFGATSGFGGTSTSAYYLADWMVGTTDTPLSGRLRILSLGDSNGFTSVEGLADANLASSTLAINTGTTYTLRLTGTYTGSTLNMSLGVFDASGTTQIGSSATAVDTTPLEGTNFGYRNRIGIGGDTFSAAFDNFSVVPEPGSAVLLSLGVIAILFVRRRRG